MIGKYGSVIIINRYDIISINDGLEIINLSPDKIGSFEIDLSKDRFKCFLHDGTSCFLCKLNASFFAIEEVQSKSFNGFTLNLYGIKNNKESYFTKDHFVPKSLGGRDHIDNYKTMCWACNSFKSNTLI